MCLFPAKFAYLPYIKNIFLMNIHTRKLLVRSPCVGRELFVLLSFVALRPMSTAMVIVGRSVHLTTLFPGQA